MDLYNRRYCQQLVLELHQQLVKRTYNPSHTFLTNQFDLRRHYLKKSMTTSRTNSKPYPWKEINYLL